jgi:hypothetical protein
MFTIIMLALATTALDSDQLRHVRATEPRILTLTDVGRSRSARFRRLFATPDPSDVIEYMEPRLTRHALGGYLGRNIVAQGEYRYLHIVIELSGSQHRLALLLAHAVRDAVEVAKSPAARDAESLEWMFSPLGGAGPWRGRGLFYHVSGPVQPRRPGWPHRPGEAWIGDVQKTAYDHPSLEDALTVTLHVTNYAAISPKELAAAEAFATTIYRAAGIQAVWIDTPWAPRETGLPHLRVVILSPEMTATKCKEDRLGASVMGTATDNGTDGSGRIAYIFAERISRTALQYDAKFERGLGHVMAHEVGHLLLGMLSHTPAGLMTADWHALEPHLQTLTPEEAQVIRVRASATEGMWPQSIHSDCDRQIEVGSRRGRDGLTRARAAACHSGAQ